MIGSGGVADAVFGELCKVDPAQSVFLLPPDSGNLRQRLCAADRVQLMAFARDLSQRLNTSAVRREVNKLSVFCMSVYTWQSFYCA